MIARKLRYLSVCLSVVLMFFLSGCVTVDYNRANSYIYINELDIPVKVEYHWDEAGYPEPILKTKTVTIEPGEELTEIKSLFGPSDAIAIISCDSIRFIFNDTEELWHERSGKDAGSVYDWDNYVKVAPSKYERTYTYRITQEIYDLATPIAE